MGPKKGPSKKFASVYAPDPRSASKQTPTDDKELGKVSRAYNARASRLKPLADFQSAGVCSPSNRTPLKPPPQKHQWVTKQQHKQKQVVVVSNYVKVMEVPQELHVYTLSFSKPGKVSGTPFVFNRRQEIKGCFDSMMLNDALSIKDQSIQWATDYRTLWTSSPIPGHAFGTTWTTPDFTYTQPNGKIADNLRADVRYKDLLKDIEQNINDAASKDLSDYISALNANVLQHLRGSKTGSQDGVTIIGANKFFMEQGYTEINGLRAVRGYFTSIRPSNAGILLNINTATSAFLPPILVSEFLGFGPMGNPDYAERILRGKLVRITYRRPEFEKSGSKPNEEEARIKTFVQFGQLANDQLFFPLLDGKEDEPRKADTHKGISVWDYFMTTYKGSDVISILESATPAGLVCVNVGRRVKSKHGQQLAESQVKEQSEGGALWIPACLLEIVPNQVISMTLGSSHTSDMIKCAAHLPARNVDLITKEGFKMLGLTKSEQKSSLVSRKFNIGHQLVSLVGTILSTPQINYAGERKPPVNDASWYLVDGQTHQKFKSISWTERQLHVLRHPNCLVDPNVAQDNLVKQLNKHGLTRVRSGDSYIVPKRSTLAEEMKTWCENADYYKDDCTLVLLKEPSLDEYSSIKREADFAGHHTLCVVGRKLISKEIKDKRGAIKLSDNGVASNISLKANLKFAGENHQLESNKLDALLGLERRKNTVILGADVTHPSKGGKGASPSIACVVGSNDSNFMNYPGSMRLQTGGQEQIEDEHMHSMVTERLQAWMDMNGQTNPPTAILFYRDGISESQFSSCTANEIVQVKNAHTDLVEKARAKLQCTIAELRDLKGKDAELKELERKKLELKDLERNKLELTFVIVGKRHHTRFYSTNENETNKMKTKENGQVQEFLSGNPRPGLLIDSMVTNPAPPNFYLQSHCALKGTARPAHYHVLEDGMSLYLESTGPLAELTYMLCYAFGRATKGVSYVAPAYIADRLCERGRVYLRPWNMNPEQRPTFTPPKDANGKLDKDKVPAAKHQHAKDLAATPEVWGRNYNLKPGKERLNPWHPCFDKVMFWM